MAWPDLCVTNIWRNGFFGCGVALFWAVGKAAPSDAGFITQISLLVFYLAIGFVPIINGHWIGGEPTPFFRLDSAHFGPLSGTIASVLLAILAIFAARFFGYWSHRIRHRIPFLWRFHAVHHGHQSLSALNSYSHPVDNFTDQLGAMVMAALIGFSYEQVIIIIALRRFYDHFIHSPLPVHLGPLGAILVNNRTHFLHHSHKKKIMIATLGHGQPSGTGCLAFIRPPPQLGLPPRVSMGSRHQKIFGKSTPLDLKKTGD